jgi:hypothetical protein
MSGISKASLIRVMLSTVLQTNAFQTSVFQTTGLRTAVLLATALLIAGCGSGSTDSTASSGILPEDQTSMQPNASVDNGGENAPDQPADTTEPDIGAVEPAPDAGAFDDTGSFDIAELFFTEADRQWFCSVTSDVSAFTDQLYVDRFGGGWFEGFGVVTWRRHESRDELIVTTATGEEWQIQEIFGSNTVLEFLLQGESAPSLYSCVLTLRDTTAA